MKGWMFFAFVLGVFLTWAVPFVLHQVYVPPAERPVELPDPVFVKFREKTAWGVGEAAAVRHIDYEKHTYLYIMYDRGGGPVHDPKCGNPEHIKESK
jgi:hypothetical protein